MITKYLEATAARSKQAAQTEAAARGSENLADFVLMEVKAVPEESLHWVVRIDTGLAWQPRALLALLTCCYANEVYGSEDIERLMCRDADFRQVCANEFPSAWVLRRFRRFNREVITGCLAKVLAGLQRQKEAGRIFPGGPGPDLTEQAPTAEAQDRVETAILCDIDEDYV